MRWKRPEWDRLVTRVHREFEEMPGLCLTLAQGARLFGLPEETCRRVLERLETGRVLRRTRRGLWVRSDGTGPCEEDLSLCASDVRLPG